MNRKRIRWEVARALTAFAVSSVFVLPCATGAKPGDKPASTPVAAGAGLPLAAVQERIDAAVKKASPSVVRIAWGWKENAGMSGVIVTSDGLVVTNGGERIPAGDTVYVYLADGRRVPGRLLGSCRFWDIGLIRMSEKGPWPHAQLGKSADAKSGDLCIAMGYPYLVMGQSPLRAAKPSPRVGHVRTSASPWWVSTTCRVESGDQGGGLFDLEGRLIALLPTKMPRITYHPAVELVQKHWDDLVAGKQIDALTPANSSRASAKSPQGAQAERPSAAGNARLAEAVKKVTSATVRLVEAGKTRGISGVIVTPDGYVATCAHHDLPPGETVTVHLPDGRALAGTVLHSNPFCDVGLMRITEKGPWPYVELGRALAVKRGDLCMLVGYPAERDYDKYRDPLIRLGFVDSLSRAEGMLYTNGFLFKPGDSGGGVFDSTGRLIGIHSGADTVPGPARHPAIELFQSQWDSLASGTDRAPSRSPDRIAEAFRSVVDGIPPVTVELLRDRKRRALGTVIGRDGWILTKASEAYGDVSCRLPDGRVLPAVMHGVSREHDLGVLKVNAENLPEAGWSNRGETPVGTLIAASGCDGCPVGTVYHAAHSVPRESGCLLAGKFRDGKGGVEIYDLTGSERDCPFEKGDIITHVEGQPTPNSRTFVELTQRPEIGVPSVIAGDPIHVKVRRGDETLELCFPLPSESYTDLRSRRCSSFPAVLSADLAVETDRCGGPVVDHSGQVVGIVIAQRMSFYGRAYVLPATVARKVANELKGLASR